MATTALLAFYPSSLADEITLVSVSPNTGDIRGWDRSVPLADWFTTPGNYTEVTLDYRLESASSGEATAWLVGIDHLCTDGSEVFPAGTGRVSKRITACCNADSPPVRHVTEISYSLMEALPGGGGRALVTERSPVDLRVLCAPPELPDLVPEVAAPPTVVAGEAIGPVGGLVARNIGGATAPGTTDSGTGYMIDLVLSTDKTVPEGFATFSETFAEDALLRGGRASNTFDVPAGDFVTYPEANAEIAPDTPPGDYFLCTRIDPGDVVDEADEANNVSCVPVTVVPATPGHVFIDFEETSNPRAVDGATATTIYADQGVRFPSAPQIFRSATPLTSGFQGLFQGDPEAGRPERTCGPLEIALSPSLRARRVRFEARNLGLIVRPTLVTVEAFGRGPGGETRVARLTRVSRSRLGDLRVFEVIDLRSTSRDITRLTVTYEECPPHVLIDNLEVWPEESP